MSILSVFTFRIPVIGSWNLDNIEHGEMPSLTQAFQETREVEKKHGLIVSCPCKVLGFLSLCAIASH
jgi:hypothetical protein